MSIGLRWMVGVMTMASVSTAQAEPDDGAGTSFASETFVLLVKGPKWSDADTAENKALMKGHLEHFTKLQASGELLVCGPFADRDDPDLRGLCIYRTPLEETRKLAEADPRVKAGHLEVKVMTWWHQLGAITYPVANPPHPPE